MSAALAAAPPLIAAGPPGWVVLGVLGAITVGIAIAAIAQNADDSVKDEGTGPTTDCPEAPADAAPVAEPRAYPSNPDDLVEQGYEEVSHPKAEKKGIRRFRNPNTGDEVEFHKGKPGQPKWEGKDHYHRMNPKQTGKGDKYLDKNGKPAPKNSDRSHLEPSK